MLKKTAILILIGIMHFGLSAGIVPGTLAVISAGDSVNQTPSLIMRTLVIATQVLHFPIISLAVYSRQWFPGNWVYIPIGINSLLWAVVIYFCIAAYRNLKKRGRRMQI
jgi:hypothetical protein